MPRAVLNPIYFDQFYGMDRRVDADKLGQGLSPLAVNVDLDRLGTVRKRKGQTILGQSGGSGQVVQAVFEFVNAAGISEIYSVKNGSIYKYDKINDIFSVVNGGSAKFTTNDQVQVEQFKNRVYFSSKSGNLCYFDGTTVIDVNTKEIDKIKATCMAVAQRTLFVGNVTFNNVTYSDRVYYSLFDTVNRVEDDKFWEAAEEGLADSTRYFMVEGGIVRNIITFSNINRVLIFSDSKCYSFDINQVATNYLNALQDVFNIGCAGEKAATVVDGVLYWMDRKGKIWAYSGNTSRPEEISYMIDDENLGASVISQIDKSDLNLSQVSAFGIGKKVYFSIGSIGLDRESLPNACIKIAASQNGFKGYFAIDTFPSRLLCGNIATINNSQFLMVGTSENILLLNSGLNDVSSDNGELAINSYYRTRSMHFSYPFANKFIDEVMVKYKPSILANNYLDMAVAVDGQVEYIPVTRPKTEVLTHGVINTYDPKAEYLGQKTSKIKLPNELKAQTISIEFSNRQLNETFEICGFGFEKISIENLNLGYHNI